MKIKEILIEIGNSSTSHGIPNIVQSKSKFLKIVWLTFSLVSTAACSYMIFKSIDNFLNFEVVTKTTLRNQLPVEFPTVSICNRSPFITDKAKSFYEKDLDNISSQLKDDEIREYKTFLAFNLSSDEKKDLGLNLEELIYTCTFNTLNCDYDKDFTWFYDIDYGNCFKFNSGKDSSGNSIELKKSFQIGIDYGLSLDIFTDDIKYPENEYTGLRIVIHNSTNNPSTFEGIMVPTGLVTNIAINRLFVHKQERPYTECISKIDNYNSELVQAILKSGYKYRQYDCFLLCLQRFLINNVSCFYPGIPNLNSTKPCLSIDEYEMYSNVYYGFLSIDQKEYCGPKCPLECDLVQYNTAVSHGNIKVSDNSDEKNTNLTLNIYFESWSYTTIEEIPKTDLFDLIANIGGTLGLFLGLSVLSFAEIFELIFLIIEFYLKKNIVSSF